MIETLSDSTVLDPGTAAALADSLQALSARITATSLTRCCVKLDQKTFTIWCVERLHLM